MITNHELYGVLDPESRDWTDGLLSKTFKEMNVDLAPGKVERRWIVYDGDVDAIWVENMNSVMDDNKILTLANGDRIRLLKHCAMLFEVFDLQYASPATISRCGMVFVDAKNLGYAPFYERWVKLKTIKYGETIGENFKDLYSKYIFQCIERVFEGNTGEELVEPLKFITPRTNLNCITQLCDLIDSIFPEPDQNPNDEFDKMDKFYIFCIIWSIGGCLIEEDREKFNSFVVGLAQQVLPQNSLYDNYFDIKKMGFIKWDDLVPAYEPPANKKFGSILVPTVDTVKYAWLLNKIMSLKKPAMFCGDSGTAKTVTVQSHFKALDNEKWMVLNINFSSRTSSLDFQNIIEENIDKRTFKQYGPKSAGKRLIIFIDDMNMPKIDTYGTQQPLALAKFLIGRLELFQRGGDLERREIVDTQFVGCITPTSSGGNRIDPRVSSLFSVFNVTPPSKDSTNKIYNSILKMHCSEFVDEIKEAIPKITQATINLYSIISEKLPRTPVKFHYIFNLRDLSKVYEGIMQSTVDKF
jgi:dynein heavy chain, axonemal